jgi:hypothetical protein
MTRNEIRAYGEGLRKPVPMPSRAEPIASQASIRQSN